MKKFKNQGKKMHQEHGRSESKSKVEVKMAIEIMELVRNCISTTADSLEKISGGSSKKSDGKSYANGYEDGVRWSLNMLIDAIDKLKKNA